MASMIATSASPVRDDTRHLSPSKTAGLLQEQSYLKQLRDQSPKPNGLVQPVVSYSGLGAVITTAGPKPTTNSRSTSPKQAPISFLQASIPPHPPSSIHAADVCTTIDADSPASQQPPQQAKQHNHQHKVAAAAAEEPAGECPIAAAAAGKRAVRQLSSNDSFTGAQLAPKRQVLDHPTGDDAAHDSARQQQQQSVDDGDIPMDEVSAVNHHCNQQQQQQQTKEQQQGCLQESSAVASGCCAQTPFCSEPAALQQHGSLDIDGNQQQTQQQQHPAGIGRSGSSSAASAAGRMLPPSTTGHRRLLLPRADSSSSSAAATTTAFATVPNTVMVGEGDHRATDAAAAGRAVDSPKQQRTESPKGEPSLSMDNILAAKATISSAASLEGWLPNTAAGEAIAAAVAAAGGSHSFLRSGSTSSSATATAASMTRQGSLSFPLPAHPPLQQQHGSSRLGSAALESQGSFAGWPGSTVGAVQGSVGSGSTLNREGSFSWPRVPPARSISEDSLKLDIQVLSPVIPEEYPEHDAAEADGVTQQQAILAQLQAAREAQQHVDRAFFAKVASWEAELVGMLEQQAAPLAIRQIVAVFKDRINTERDKTEFKSICDKWTSVVEYPVGSGTKCLAIKSWMRSDM